ncbi:hypothetical protein ACJMK2_014063 [Sinanodonta woodiana]|uniref:Uncharacterized protein n=1 Tax=Sinanodonta woodiana TaxID=1069815 RepID=A0ABD3V2K4_SINWO
MDFAENYTCGFVEEIQNKNAVTLHPVVIHTKDKEDEVKVKHTSLVVLVVSDELSLTSLTVFAIMKHVVKEVKAVLQNVEMVHYMTDLPTSQYKNKLIFSILFWLYFEAGHGKGPCDGVVATSADDFLQWGKTQENSALKYIFVPKSHCTEAHEELSNLVGKQMKDELYQVNTYVAAIYESRWYVGQVLEYDKDDQEYNIKFMVAGKNFFKWPVKPDQIWIPSSDVLCSLDEPIKQGKTHNMFKFSGRDFEKVRNLFDRLCTCNRIYTEATMCSKTLVNYVTATFVFYTSNKTVLCTQSFGPKHLMV